MPPAQERDHDLTAPFPRSDADLQIVVVRDGNEPDPALLGSIESYGHIHRVCDKEKEIAQVIEETDVLFIWPSRSPSLANNWDKARRLSWIHTATVGVDGLLFPQLVNSPVPLTNSSGVFDLAIAEYVLGLLLAFAKGLPATLDLQGSHTWRHRETETLAGRHLLLIGAGHISRAIANLVKGVGMTIEVVANNRRSGDPLFGEILGQADLYNALERADYVVLAAPLTEDNHSMFDAKAFAHMKSNARLINIGRGGLIDEDALLQALDLGQLAAVALDVFRREPLPTDHPLWGHENVIVSPHMAGDFKGWQYAIVELFVDNLARFRSSQPLRNIVDKQRGYGNVSPVPASEPEKRTR